MDAVVLETPLREFGPFAGRSQGDATLRRLARKRPACYISNEQQMATLTLLRDLKALSSAQIAALKGVSPRTIREHLKQLWLNGLVDRLETAASPCLYTTGHEAARLLGTSLEAFSIASAFRIAAANQLYVIMRHLWPETRYEVAPHEGVTAHAEIGDSTYAVLAPRLFPGDVVWCEEMMDYVPGDMRILVICASRAQAEEIATGVSLETMARFTWDTELAHAFRLYKRFAGGLELAENFEIPH